MTTATQLSLLDAAQHAGPYQPSSETSFEAALAAGPKISPQKRRILEYFAVWEEMNRIWGEDPGVTQDETSQWTTMPRSTICARFNEMERDGVIRKTARTRLSQYDRPCAVYVLSAPPFATLSNRDGYAPA
jgi:hypothetical protein